MAIARPWTREETMLVINLYCRIPFGRQHSRNPEIIELAEAIHRTPSSVAMKLNNITSIDPEENKRGVRGLRGSSKLDQMTWEEFQNDWENMAAESERLWQETVTKTTQTELPSEGQSDISIESITLENQITFPTGPTETIRLVKVRSVQTFFRFFGILNG